MLLDLSEVELSKNDLKREIKLPKIFTLELAEDVGFHIGDGYMKKVKDNFGVHYKFEYAGDFRKDLSYFENVLIPRKKLLFNLDKIKVKNFKLNNLSFRFHSKGLYLFYKDVLKVKESPKKDIDIPKWIFKSLGFQKAFLRGIMDSDGCFRTVKKNYPLIDATSQSKGLIRDLGLILNNLKIPFSSYYVKRFDKRTDKIYTQYRVQISGRNNVPKFMKLVGFNNLKHIQRYNEREMGLA